MEEENTTPTQPEGFNIEDMQNVLRIIDWACDQGAFKGWETIKNVLIIRTKLDTFVTAALAELEAQQKQKEEAAPEAATGE